MAAVPQRPSRYIRQEPGLHLVDAKELTCQLEPSMAWTFNMGPNISGLPPIHCYFNTENEFETINLGGTPFQEKKQCWRCEMYDDVWLL